MTEQTTTTTATQHRAETQYSIQQTEAGWTVVAEGAPRRSCAAWHRRTRREAAALRRELEAVAAAECDRR
jgi:hypothetical protein